MAGAPYLGWKISLISKSQIRYEGILYTVDSKESTIALAKVKSMGTEDRPTDRPIPPRDEVYEYIIFRASDIKDINVCDPPKTSPGSLPSDPAIVQQSAPVAATCSVPMSVPQPSFGVCNLSGLEGYIGQLAAYQLQQSLLGHGSRSASSHYKNLTDAGVQVTVNDLLDKSAKHEEAPMSVKIGKENVMPPYSQRNYPSNRRGSQRGRGPRRGRGGRGAARPQTRAPLKFDNEYDFEQANEEFKELVQKMSKLETSASEEGTKETTEITTSEEEIYDKQKSFFDNISCEASRVAKGIPRFDWRIERKINVETFGVPTSSNTWFRRRRGGMRNRGGRGNRNVSRQLEPIKSVSFGVRKLTPLQEETEAVEECKAEEIPTIEIVAVKDKDDE